VVRFRDVLHGPPTSWVPPPVSSADLGGSIPLLLVVPFGIVFVLLSLRRPRCRRGLAYAGIASLIRQSSCRRGGNDAGGRCYLGFNIISSREERKMGYGKCRSPFFRRTGWASHFLGPPLCFPSPIPRSSKYLPAHIPLERGSGCHPVCASRGVDGGAHIPQERGGARGQVVAGGCGLVVVARVVARVVVVVE